MTRYKSAMLDRLSTLENAVDGIFRSIERIEVATIVRDPSSKVAVEAYEGLRRQVVAAAGERMAHLHQLALFAEALTTATSVAELRSLVDEWFVQSGVERLTDPHDPNYFDVLGGTGSELRVLRPAYRDGSTGRPILMGHAERVEPTRTPRHQADDEPRAEGKREAVR